MPFLCVISIFDSNIGNYSYRCLKMFVTVEISINVHLVLKDDLEFSKWINRDGHYIQRDQYVQKPWNWRYTGRVRMVMCLECGDRVRKWCYYQSRLERYAWPLSGIISVSKNKVNSLQSCLSEDLYNLLFITEYKKQTIGASTYYVPLIYFSPIVGTLWVS